jgi:hypothetical protein
MVLSLRVRKEGWSSTEANLRWEEIFKGNDLSFFGEKGIFQILF